MASIRDIRNPWRDALVPASFDGNEFFVEQGSREGGQRLVIHEFPKKDMPYTEAMGRRYIAFSVRAYLVASAMRPDYRPQRDALQQRLDEAKPGSLQLPSMPPMKVYCRQYRLTEEEKYGGYCTFDIQFVEAGSSPFAPAAAPAGQVLSAGGGLQQRVLARLGGSA